MSSLPIELLRTVSAAKVVDNRLLNRLGIQVARALVAHGLHSVRQAPLRGAATAAQLRALEDDGIVTIENFLPAAEFEAVRQEALQLLAARDGRVHVHGPNRVHQRALSEADNMPHLEGFFRHPALRDLLDAGERMTIDPQRALFAVEELSQGDADDLDPETELHADVFFATHKGWLYLDDVTVHNAPFVYVKGSHKMPTARLRYEYAASCTDDRRSRRITPAERTERGLVETVCFAPANTLVVANTCGYHRRLRGRPGGARRAVHFSHRHNPFLPTAIDPARLAKLAWLKPARALLSGDRFR
jgi:hypothetical protein